MNKLKSFGNPLLYFNSKVAEKIQSAADWIRHDKGIFASGVRMFLTIPETVGQVVQFAGTVVFDAAAYSTSYLLNGCNTHCAAAAVQKIYNKIGNSVDNSINWLEDHHFPIQLAGDMYYLCGSISGLKAVFTTPLALKENFRATKALQIELNKQNLIQQSTENRISNNIAKNQLKAQNGKVKRQNLKKLRQDLLVEIRNDTSLTSSFGSALRKIL
jgi:hypothetical protein